MYSSVLRAASHTRRTRSVLFCTRCSASLGELDGGRGVLTQVNARACRRQRLASMHVWVKKMHLKEVHTLPAAALENGISLRHLSLLLCLWHAAQTLHTKGGAHLSENTSWPSLPLMAFSSNDSLPVSAHVTDACQGTLSRSAASVLMDIV